MSHKEDNEQLKFNSPQDEISFLRLRLEETNTEFKEFQESSRELELEYETQVEQLEKKNKDSLNQISRLEDENGQLKSKYNSYTNDTQHKLNEYQQQISELNSLNDRLTSYIRELEQNNDDLERAQRALASSVDDFEGKLNEQIERNVLLENEVSEKEELECMVQRLKEEVRDLRHELIVSKNSAETSRLKTPAIPTTPAIPSMPSIIMTPSSRISAINIVSNLLRKIGALESRLAPAKKVPTY